MNHVSNVCLWWVNKLAKTHVSCVSFIHKPAKLFFKTLNIVLLCCQKCKRFWFNDHPYAVNGLDSSSFHASTKRKALSSALCDELVLGHKEVAVANANFCAFRRHKY